jgi:hypothetical protein
MWDSRRCPGIYHSVHILALLCFWFWGIYSTMYYVCIWMLNILLEQHSFKTFRHKTIEFTVYKWLRNYNMTMTQSSLTCRKWWRARHSWAQECQTVRHHCLWYSGIRSPTNRFLLTGPCYNWEYFKASWHIHRLWVVSKPSLWINFIQNPN